jgi:hypothetical protein
MSKKKEKKGGEKRKKIKATPVKDSTGQLGCGSLPWNPPTR